MEQKKSAMLLSALWNQLDKFTDSAETQMKDNKSSPNSQGISVSTKPSSSRSTESNKTFSEIPKFDSKTVSQLSVRPRTTLLEPKKLMTQTVTKLDADETEINERFNEFALKNCSDDRSHKPRQYKYTNSEPNRRGNNRDRRYNEKSRDRYQHSSKSREGIAYGSSQNPQSCFPVSKNSNQKKPYGDEVFYSRNYRDSQAVPFNRGLNEQRRDRSQFRSKSNESSHSEKSQNYQSHFCGNRNIVRFGYQKRNYNQTEETASSNCRKGYKMSFTALNELVAKNPNEILLSINQKGGSFMMLIKEENLRFDMMALILTCLGKACTASLNQNVCSLLNTICSNQNFLILSIQRYLVSIRTNKIQMKDYHFTSLVFLTVFLQKFQHTLPSSSSEIISMLLPLLQTTSEDLLKGNELYNDVIVTLKEIKEENDRFLSEHTPSEIKKSSYREKMQLSEPPESFRSLPVLPTIDDVYSHAFLRPNIVEGKYSDTEQYLDIQYRLLREDYVRPLRNGIAEYLALKKAGKSVKNCRDVKVYETVHIVKQDFVNGGIVHIAQFSNQNFSKIKWEYSKRLLSGSLLCFSSDNFETMLFASVARRIPSELQKGLLLIRFEDISDEVLNLTPLRSFVVIETSAYFEAYRHNLKALHQLNEASLPFKKYIINVENTVENPKYLKENITYDMRPLLIPMEDTSIKRVVDASNNVSIQYEYPVNISSVYKSVQVLNDSFWPSASSLNLDDSQYLALKAAVTKEFAIIQGPPGTGKTYVGLRIVQLLLHNIDKWFTKHINSLPILIVCYTNHALDQFLEGVMLFTDKIVRIGGRGSNEAVSKYQLSNLKQNAIQKKQIPKYISAGMWHKNHELKGLKVEIDRINNFILKTAKTVLEDYELVNVMPSVHYESLKRIASEYNLFDDGRMIHDWLGIRSRFEGNDSVTYEIETVPVPSKSNISLPEPNESDDVDNESVGEADIEFIEAQRDIDSEEFADVSFDIKNVGEREEIVFQDDAGWQVQGGMKQRLKFVKNCLRNSEPLTEEEAMRITDVWKVPVPRRWQLYKYWLQLLIIEKQEECLAKQLILKQQFKELCEMRTEGDVFLLENSHVVGMTTTGAAKYRDIVLRLNPQILIVEEAAEILESHIVTSLAPRTQQVILIGDHQQLRPSPTVHLLAVKYDLDISLFERMIKNKMDCFRLSIQHRMRPEVAELIVPHIYKDLQNHESVIKYESIKGVNKNVFFVTHNYSELQESDSKSKVNDHEAKFLIKLCKYFVLQGYDPSQITVLTTYSGQLFAMKKLVTDRIRKVKLTVVDNFQGEENDIILISFVRSNEDGEIGFLKIANRVCVALSRAKKGLFCIGNFELLTAKSDLWKNIISTLQKKQAIGPSLQLVCQNHPSVYNVVENEKDFDSVPEGGCTKPCEYRLACGHVCSLMCHPYDSAHENVRCHKPCSKTCNFGHKCPRKCFQECRDCIVLIDKTVFPCKHTIKINCYMQDSEIKCTAMCDKLLVCGHRCSNTCSENCTVLCREKVRIKSPLCGHMVTVECKYKNNSEVLLKHCKSPCKTVLGCSHVCSGNCYHCLQGRLHVACKQPCKRILVCGHECKAPCAKSCPPCKVPCENRCIHSKCPKTCGEPCKECTEPCQWHCDHQKCSRSCGKICYRIPCNKPCQNVLRCGHRCIGFCGEPCPEECRKCDSEKVKEIFFGTEDDDDARFVRLEDCNHILEISGLNEWMKTEDKGDHQIQMKTCPKCKTVIRTNLRFGNTVKACLKQIEAVKNLTFGNSKVNKKKQKELLNYLEINESILRTLNSGTIYETWHKILSSKYPRSIQEIITLENILNISLQLANVIQHLSMNVLYTDQEATVKEGLEVLSLFMKSSANSLVDFIEDEFLTTSEYQLQQLTWEIQRLSLGTKILNLSAKRKIHSGISDFEKCISVLIKYSAFSNEDLKNFSSSYQNFASKQGSAVINISEIEKHSILKAMNLTAGHWYQCVNGHVYCITECGGAMEESRCNECNARIGGSGHRLLEDNRVATDMDGARVGAWSNTVNLLNDVMQNIHDQVD